MVWEGKTGNSGKLLNPEQQDRIDRFVLAELDPFRFRFSLCGEIHEEIVQPKLWPWILWPDKRNAAHPFMTL